MFSPDYAGRTLLEHFKLLTLDGCGLAGRPAAVCAAGAILHYLRETQRAALDHLDLPTHFDRDAGMVLDAVTVRNLELVEPLFGEGATLLGILDQTQTGMGGRLLRQRLLRPSMDRAEIEARLDAVGEMLGQTILRNEVRRELEGILDLERLLSKITLGIAGPRDVLALGRSLEKIPAVKRCFQTQQAARLRGIYDALDECPEARDRILDAISDDAPANLGDGGAIRPGYNAELDELRDLSLNSRRYIAQIEERERARTGIGSLKVRFNNVFGYYIEVSKANLRLAPPDYERKQTLVNAERFTTPELKEYERKVLDAEEKILVLERELFAEVRQFAASHGQRIRAAAAAIAELDVTAALAQVAAENRYRRPSFSGDSEMRIVAGRHPVIERMAEQEGARFIPNDLYLNQTSDLIAIITGPNMGGKSTYLRQAALIAIMAQMGSFVPADSAALAIVDRIFTRIGASDNLARGRSTFMVEMTDHLPAQSGAGPRRPQLRHRSGAAGGPAHGGGRAGARGARVARAQRAHRHRGVEPAPRRTRADPAVRAGGPQHRRAHPCDGPGPPAAHRSPATAGRVAEGAEELVRVAGVMSGTSLDGIDVAIVDITGRRVKTAAFRTTPYSRRTRAAVLAVSNAATTTAAIARLNFRLGELYAAAIVETCRRAHVPLESVELIGCHGQTIYHEGGVTTMQIGEADVIAERTGIPVVADFRTRDIAAGGKGAPLVPYVDYLLFRHPRRGRIALNIGGIANITAIPAAARPEDVIAFDTGPGNMVIDALAGRYTHGRLRYDRDGRIAARGRVIPELLDRLLADPYYRRKPPKTAGREQYGEEFVARLKGSLPDLMATATALTAATIALGIRQVGGGYSELIVSGGGAHNPRIMAQLAAFLPGLAICTSSDYGIDLDAKEAIAFAVLAAETWRRKASNLPSATGARRAAVLGKVSY